MSMEDDDARQYRCFNKYQQIVKQVVLLDELTDSIDPTTAKISKGKKKSKGSSTSTSANSTVSKNKEEGFDQVMVHTLSTFLHDLNPSKALLSNNNPLHAIAIDQQSSSTSQLSAPSTAAAAAAAVSRQLQK